jgi:hypothetical protein
LALTELKGQQTGTQRVVIERGPVRVFAQALGDPATNTAVTVRPYRRRFRS